IDEDGRQRPVDIERVLVSTQHSDGISSEDLIKPDIIERVLRPILPPELYDERRLMNDRDFVYVNPTGKFVIGGPMGDTGLTCRDRSTRRPLRTATSGATTTTSRGSAPTRRTPCARPRASWSPRRPESVGASGAPNEQSRRGLVADGALGAVQLDRELAGRRR